MADKKISALTGATTPLVGSEILPIVQSGSTVKVSVDNLTSGKVVSALSFAVTGSAAPANGIYLPATNELGVATNSTPRMRITSAGNVGIATSSPENRLQISYTSTAPSLSSSAGAGLSLVGSSTLRVNIGSDPSVPYGGWIQATNGTGGNFALNLNPLGGDVGIGTSSPGKKLDVAGSIRSSGAGSDNFFCYDGSTSTSLQQNGNDLYFNNNVDSATPGGFSWRTTSSYTERMRITNTGNIQLGTASLATNATNGFPYIPTCAGTPTGTPTTITGYAPMVVDSTNNKLYVYVGGAWTAMN